MGGGGGGGHVHVYAIRLQPISTRTNACAEERTILTNTYFTYKYGINGWRTRTSNDRRALPCAFGAESVRLAIRFDARARDPAVYGEKTHVRVCVFERVALEFRASGFLL